MAKPVINYKGHMTENPSDCNQVKTLEEAVYHAIDRGLIAGLKPSAARSIADMWGQRNPCKTGVCARSIGLKHAAMSKLCYNTRHENRHHISHAPVPGPFRMRTRQLLQENDCDHV